MQHFGRNADTNMIFKTCVIPLLTSLTEQHQREKEEIVRETKDVIGFVDTEFLKKNDTEFYPGEWLINKDRERMHAELKQIATNHNIHYE